MYDTYVQLPAEAEEDVGSPGAGVTSGCESPDTTGGYWKLNLSSLVGQQMFSSAKPSLQPLGLVFLILYKIHFGVIFHIFYIKFYVGFFIKMSWEEWPKLPVWHANCTASMSGRSHAQLKGQLTSSDVLKNMLLNVCQDTGRGRVWHEHRQQAQCRAVCFLLSFFFLCI